MFVRFRQSPGRLQLSLIETRRVGGQVRHEHVASFGSIKTPPTVAGRIIFWQRLHERIGKLSNPIDPTAQAQISGQRACPHSHADGRGSAHAGA